MKINCKVISAYYGYRRNSDLSGMLEVLKYHIKYEQELDSGVFNDTIIVNHENDFELPHRDEFYKLLKDIDGTKTKNGVFKVIHRPFQDGIGGSFASFNYAFEMFKDQYEYWFFTEDNVMTIKNDVFNKCIEQLKSNNNVRFIGCLRRNKHNPPSHIKNRRHPEHNYGGCGCVHIDSLFEVYNKYGMLPYSTRPMTESMINQMRNSQYIFLKDEDGRQWYRRFELDGEVKFTNAYVKLGYILDIFHGTEPITRWIHIKDGVPIIDWIG